MHLAPVCQRARVGGWYLEDDGAGLDLDRSQQLEVAVNVGAVKHARHTNLSMVQKGLFGRGRVREGKHTFAKRI